MRYLRCMVMIPVEVEFSLTNDSDLPPEHQKLKVVRVTKPTVWEVEKCIIVRNNADSIVKPIANIGSFYIYQNMGR